MRRRVGLFLMCGLVLPLVAAANASAQGAVLELSPQSGPPGTVVSVEGAGFSQASDNIIGGVNLRFMTRDALVLRNAELNPQNGISTTLTIPAGTAAGEYLVLATQTSVRGRHLFGTPARAKFRVTPAGAAAATAAPSGPAVSPTAIVIASTLLALILLAGGTLAARSRRAPDQPLGGHPTTSSR